MTLGRSAVLLLDGPLGRLELSFVSSSLDEVLASQIDVLSSTLRTPLKTSAHHQFLSDKKKLSVFREIVFVCLREAKRMNLSDKIKRTKL